MKIPISVIILTYNEESIIEDCFKSVVDWVSEIIVVDSYSTDGTLKIAERYGAKIFQHPFENFSQQRNWALNNLTIENEWILNLDADQRITQELKKELITIFSNPINPIINGFLMSRRTIFMGRWIKHGGHYPVYHAPLFRKGFGFFEDRLYDQHFIVNGKTKILKGDIIDIIADSLTRFTERHNKWSNSEVEEQLYKNNQLSGRKLIKGNIFGDKREKRRALRNFYHHLPLFSRAFFYFIYRYFFRLGFLDGKEGLIFHFLQGFWYRFLVDAKLFEIKRVGIEKSIKV